MAEPSNTRDISDPRNVRPTRNVVAERDFYLRHMREICMLLDEMSQHRSTIAQRLMGGEYEDATELDADPTWNREITERFAEMQSLSHRLKDSFISLYPTRSEIFNYRFLHNMGGGLIRENGYLG